MSTDIPQTMPEKGEWDSFVVEGDPETVIVYDIGNGKAWIQSDTTAEDIGYEE